MTANTRDEQELQGLPEGWVETTLGELVALNPKNAAADETEAGFLPMSNLGTRFMDVPKFDVKSWGDIKKGYTHFSNGDVLLAKITPCFENGKSGIPENLPNGLGAGSTEYFVCRPMNDCLNSKYLLAFFQTETFIRVGAVNMTGSVGHKRVPKEYVTDSLFLLPPLAEQIRIADKLDALLSRVEAGRERLERVPKLLKRLRQSVLSAAVSGELTREWRGGGDAEWEETNLGSIIKIRSGKQFTEKNVEEILEGDAIYSKVGDMNLPENRLGILTSRTVVVSGNFKENDLMPVGSVVFPKRGGAIATNKKLMTLIPLLIDLNTMALIPGERITSRYLFRFMGSIDIGLLNNGSTIPQVNNGDIEPLSISLPPLPEQDEIVRRVEALFAIADRIEARYKVALTTFNRLTPALLAKAFRGELVPQDPGDEPASVLLERIRAERAISGDKPKRGRGAAKEAGSAKSDSPAPDNTAPKRRGRPPKAQVEAPDIAQASSYEDAVRQLEAQKAARAAADKPNGAQTERGTRQGELFGVED